MTLTGLIDSPSKSAFAKTSTPGLKFSNPFLSASIESGGIWQDGSGIEPLIASLSSKDSAKSHEEHISFRCSIFVVLGIGITLDCCDK